MVALSYDQFWNKGYIRISGAKNYIVLVCGEREIMSGTASNVR